MIRYADSEDVAKDRIIAVLRKARLTGGVEVVQVLKDGVARVVFLEESQDDTVSRLVGRREVGEIESVVWLAVGVCDHDSVSECSDRQGWTWWTYIWRWL